MDEPSPARWLTFRELAAETGLSVPAAEARARRMVRAGRWRHRIDNDPPNAGRVLLTPADLDAMRRQGVAVGGAQPVPPEGAPGEPPGGPLEDALGGIDHGTVHALLAETKAAHELVVGELQRRAERAEGEAATLRDALDRERARAEAAAAEREQARVQAAAAEGEAKGLRMALEEARRPFWRRWFGP